MLTTNRLNDTAKVKTAMCYYAVAHELRKRLIDRESRENRIKKAGGIPETVKKLFGKITSYGKSFNKGVIKPITGEVKGIINDFDRMSKTPHNPVAEAYDAEFRLQQYEFAKRMLRDVKSKYGLNTVAKRAIDKQLAYIQHGIDNYGAGGSFLVNNTNRDPSILTRLKNLSTHFPGGENGIVLGATGAVGAAGLTTAGASLLPSLGTAGGATALTATGNKLLETGKNAPGYELGYMRQRLPVDAPLYKVHYAPHYMPLTPRNSVPVVRPAYPVRRFPLPRRIL